MTEETKVSVRANTPVVDSGAFSELMDTARFDQIQRVGKMFANSTLVPAHFQKQEANAMVAVQMAMRLNVDPMMLMQNMYIISGKPGMEAKLAIALVNSRGPFTGPIQYKLEGEGDKRQCTAFATHKATKELCSAVCSIEIAKKEGWYSKPGSKWQTMPDMMLCYRAAMFLARLYAPECLMGMNSKEELEDIDAAIDVTPAREGDEPKRNSLKEKLGINEQKGVRAAAIVGEAEVVQERPAEALGQQGAQAASAEAAQTDSGGGPGETETKPEPPFPVNTLCSMMKKVKTAEALAEVDDILRNPAYSDEDRAAVNKWRPTLSS